ncbi:hypothetical protein CSKR_102832 [Clonorchis sinensis]|uniref:Uncharacterized protein n=2 Tax=Clonorchis sinensis TaxID=79923 RepID=G7YFR6_CLOSI|nr:hypothetical protein CSKR_102832 [Clonorchis sinensis]GAA51799.1 hypothetical protein CLF_106811 [Clonorchis sinensis]
MRFGILALLLAIALLLVHSVESQTSELPTSESLATTRRMRKLPFHDCMHKWAKWRMNLWDDDDDDDDRDDDDRDD